jgi:ribosomal protein L4
MKNSHLRFILCAALLCGGLAVAQKTQPVENVNPQRHGNLAAAQRLSEKAYEKVVAAQQANEFDLGGHAKKAKELLEQVNQELKMAAETANQNHK